jgi:hypothetical protein
MHAYLESVFNHGPFARFLGPGDGRRSHFHPRKEQAIGNQASSPKENQRHLVVDGFTFGLACTCQQYAE